MTLALGLRSSNLFSKRDAAASDTPAQTRVPAKATSYDDSADGFEDEFSGRMRQPGVRLSFHGGIVPKSRWGRIAAGCGLVLLMGSGVVGFVEARSFLLHDEHFLVDGAESIQIVGNSHLTRPQLLSVFGGDVQRNVFNIPLGDRRTELESLPWVAHATVMRLLPNQVRVEIVERKPVAFVRQGHEIGLVDATGVLLDMAADGSQQRREPQYSFPVLTGISASDPLSTRAARMKIYAGFVAALDATGENVSRRLSEVDVSNPEDVRAVFSESGAESGAAGANGLSAGADVLVHFGDERFLERYHQYQQHLAEWRTQYPHLASVDMRYERQVVLEMQPGTSLASAADPVASGALKTAGAGPKAGDIVGKSAGTAKSVMPTPAAKAVEKSGAPASGAPGISAAAGKGRTPGPGKMTGGAKGSTGGNTAAATSAGTTPYTPHLMTFFPVNSGTKASAGAKSAGASRPAGSAQETPQ